MLQYLAYELAPPATTTYRILAPRDKLIADIEHFGLLMPASKKKRYVAVPEISLLV